MSYVTNQSTPDSLRTRLEALRQFHGALVRSGDEHLRAAMADYAQHARAQQQLQLCACQG